MWRILFCSFLLAACSQSPSKLPDWQAINGRDRGRPTDREAIYRARVPSSWVRYDPEKTDSNVDTMLPICLFKTDNVEIAVHNFPYDRIGERIPPEAQVARWQRQLTDSDPGAELTIPYGHGGFSGLRFEGIGTLDDTPDTMVIGYALQLAPEHFQVLVRPPFSSRRQQQRGDYTIKVKGLTEQVVNHREEIEAFARSFELIEEVPHR
jgi:hypothetical protein